jgi:glucose/mannose-6-phosphate isomerase
MVNLDDLSGYSRVDPSSMRDRIRELPGECLKAWQQALAFELPRGYADVDRIVVLGMGGSAIGGDLLSSLCALEAKAPPVSVCRDYDLPLSLSERTLVIASSYSGMTEETLSAFEQALATPAKKLVLTTGGDLKALADRNRIPVFIVSYAAQPRAALAHSFLPLLGFCQKLGLVSHKSADMAAMARVLEELQRTIDEHCPLSRNPAKQLAIRLLGHVAVVYGAGFLSPVAERWKTQTNENSKAWAFCEAFSELNHNAVVGYEFPADLAGRFFAVMLRSPLLHRRTQLRYRLTAEILSQAKVSHETLDARGENALSQMMSLVLFGDWVSYYLAILNETDPTPVKVIESLKKRLAES